MVLTCGGTRRSDLPQWKRDKAQSDRLIPELKRICGEYLIGEAPEEDDAERNTDLIVLKLAAVRIACRIRTHEYMEAYGGEFTIRSSRPTGTKTELAKIIEGWGDYFLYGFSDAAGRILAAWMLGDLKVFRHWFASQLVKNKGNIPGTECANKDGSSLFRAFRIDALPSNFIKARRQA
ncbi:MAG: hypothetical protein Q7T82_15270 [Armatimonadota bacterium]|nr:hypothetical protein [Armatimonadota bacterium]